MKRALKCVLLFSLILILSFTGCSSDKKASDNNKDDEEEEMTVYKYKNPDKSHDIVLKKTDGTFEVIKHFGYEDFKSRL